MSTTIVIPAMRAHRIVPLVQNIREVTPEPHRIVMVIGDDELEECCKDADVEYVRDEGDTWGHRLNQVARTVESPYMFCGADDVLFHTGWLSEALEVMRSVNGVVSVNDLHNPNDTLPLVSLDYYRNPGCCVDTPEVIIYPGYFHNYSETELYETAKARNRFAQAQLPVVEHLHPNAHKSANDAIYELGHSKYGADEALWASRNHLWGNQ